MESTILKEIYQEGIIKGKQEGQKEGLEMGRLETARDDILEILHARKA